MNPIDAVSQWHALRDAFTELDRQGLGADVRLVHRALNLEAECVAWKPPKHRRGKFRRDWRAGLRTQPPPPVAREILTSAGDGEADAFRRFGLLAARAGRLLLATRPRSLELLCGWTFRNDPAGPWWTLVFELAWAGCHPLLHAERLLWWERDGVSLTAAYDRELLRAMPQSLRSYPPAWADRLPETYFADMTDPIAACAAACDLLAGESAPPPAAVAGQGASAPAAKAMPTIDDLSPAVKDAWLRYQDAAEAMEKDAPTVRAAYEFLRQAAGRELRLPTLQTWERNIRRARKKLGMNLNSRRSGRPHGSSIIRFEDAPFKHSAVDGDDNGNDSAGE